MIGQSEIRRVLPHRFPMLLLDRVTEIVPGRRVTAVKAVSCNEPCYQHLGPQAAAGDYAYPRVLLTESWCQSAGLLATWEAPDPDVIEGKVMLFGSVSGVEYHRPVLPGDVLVHQASISRVVGDTVVFDGESRVNGVAVMTVERAVMAFRQAGTLGRTDDRN